MIPPRFRRSLTTVAFAASFAVLRPTPCEGASFEAESHQVTAAFVYNFLRFTTWPEGVRGEDQLRLCTHGVGDALRFELDRYAAQATPNARFRLVPLEITDDPTSCHAIYVDASVSALPKAWLERVRDRPALTVSTHPAFTRAGGHIRLFRAGDRMRFEVDLEAVRRSGITLSSKLLRLAKIAEQRSPQQTQHQAPEPIR